MPTVVRDIVVSNKLGLHARPAMQLVDLANQFQSTITIHKGGAEPVDADAKSVMQVIILAAEKGTTLRFQADGDDAEQAIAALAKLFESNFDEEQ